MRIALLAAAAGLALLSQASYAQDFRGVRIEGNIGGDRFQSEGARKDKFGYGATVGFDGVIANKIVIGAEGNFWRDNNWAENCTNAVNGRVCHKSFEEWGAAIRAGYLVTPQFLVFGKGGYVTNEQRKRFTAPIAANSYYDHFNTDGYQLGGGVEYSLTQGRMPAYVNVQYVSDQFNDHTSRHRVMGGIGIRFK